MIIGASGVTLAKIRKHTGAQIEVIQDTANDGFSVAHVAGTLEQVLFFFGFPLINRIVLLIATMLDASTAAID